MDNLLKYIEFANKNSTKQQLEFLLNKIPEREGFDNLLPSQYIFLIKVYIGKILEMYENEPMDSLKQNARIRIQTVLKNKHIYLDDFYKMNQNTALQDMRDVAKYFIVVYKNKKEDQIGI